MFAAFHQVVQFAAKNLHIERFGDIIIRPGFETDNDVFALHLRRQHDNRCLRSARIGLQLLAGLKTVFHRHHHVAKDQVRIVGKGNLYSLLPITSFENLIFLSKDMFQEPTDLVAVVDDKDFLTGELFLRDNLNKFGDLFLLTVVQSHQVSFGFYKFHPAFHQVLFA